MSLENFLVLDASVRKCVQITGTNFYELDPSWIAEAALALLLINMKDALISAAKLNKRVTFSEDLPDGKDITDAVADMRNAICHNGSPLRQFDKNTGSRLSFGRLRGSGLLLDIGGVQLGSPHPDDFAFFYGSQRLFLKRHLVRAIADLQQIRNAAAKEFNYPL